MLMIYVVDIKEGYVRQRGGQSKSQWSETLSVCLRSLLILGTQNVLQCDQEDGCRLFARLIVFMNTVRWWGHETWQEVLITRQMLTLPNWSLRHKQSYHPTWILHPSLPSVAKCQVLYNTPVLAISCTWAICVLISDWNRILRVGGSLFNLQPLNPA
jgi:hypothetical protein